MNTNLYDGAFTYTYRGRLDGVLDEKKHTYNTVSGVLLPLGSRAENICYRRVAKCMITDEAGLSVIEGSVDSIRRYLGKAFKLMKDLYVPLSLCIKYIDLRDRNSRTQFDIQPDGVFEYTNMCTGDFLGTLKHYCDRADGIVDMLKDSGIENLHSYREKILMRLWKDHPGASMQEIYESIPTYGDEDMSMAMLMPRTIIYVYGLSNYLRRPGVDTKAVYTCLNKLASKGDIGIHICIVDNNVASLDENLLKKCELTVLLPESNVKHTKIEGYIDPNVCNYIDGVFVGLKHLYSMDIEEYVPCHVK